MTPCIAVFLERSITHSILATAATIVSVKSMQVR